MEKLNFAILAKNFDFIVFGETHGFTVFVEKRGLHFSWESAVLMEKRGFGEKMMFYGYDVQCNFEVSTKTHKFWF